MLPWYVGRVAVYGGGRAANTFFVGGVCQGFGTFVTEIVVHVVDLVGL